MSQCGCHCHETTASPLEDSRAGHRDGLQVHLADAVPQSKSKLTRLPTRALGMRNVSAALHLMVIR